MPRSAHGKGQAHQMDALDAAELLEGDVAYIDPPYNQHSYLGNYHIWESLVRWDKPPVYGVAMKRCDVRERGSRFNRRGAIEGAVREVVGAVRARWILVSFNDEGYLTPQQMQGLLEAWGPVRTVAVPYRRYVGHQIGIYSPDGVKVGTPGPDRNRELLFLVDARGVTRPGRARMARGRAAQPALN